MGKSTKIKYFINTTITIFTLCFMTSCGMKAKKIDRRGSSSGATTSSTMVAGSINPFASIDSTDQIPALTSKKLVSSMSATDLSGTLTRTISYDYSLDQSQRITQKTTVDKSNLQTASPSTLNKKETYTYDQNGNVSEYVQTYDTYMQTMTLSYDGNTLVKTVTKKTDNTCGLVNQVSVQYTYDGNGKLSRVVNTDDLANIELNRQEVDWTTKTVTVTTPKYKATSFTSSTCKLTLATLTSTTNTVTTTKYYYLYASATQVSISVTGLIPLSQDVTPSTAGASIKTTCHDDGGFAVCEESSSNSSLSSTTKYKAGILKYKSPYGNTIYGLIYVDQAKDETTNGTAAHSTITTTFQSDTNQIVVQSSDSVDTYDAKTMLPLSSKTSTNISSYKYLDL